MFIHINEVKVDDVVRCQDGHLRTVCRKDINTSGFMGTTLFGDSYQLGTKPVEIVGVRK